jgi:hypothetical protein
MRKNLLLTFLAVLYLSIASKAQSLSIVDGGNMDSVVLNFDSTDISDFVTDTSGLWQIGSTNKTFFSSGGFIDRAMMTDTVNTYPVGANAWFILEFPVNFNFNVIVDFTHKYQTDPGKDGCIVEFSNDGGQSWQNVKGDCNQDTMMYFPGVHTENLYGYDDTLENGERAFSGESNGWIHSRIQFLYGLPVKSTATCDMQDIKMRFRFVSDSTAETMDGWIISGITIEQDEYSGIKDIAKREKLNVFPNPSADGQFYFPEFTGKDEYTMEIINSFGQTIYRNDYQRSIDLSKYAKGLYFYKVNGEKEQYSGQLIVN